MKLVSVIVSVYEVEKYIAATLRSILEQTYKNYEVLIIDDGSPDRSVEICQQFTDPRIKIVRQQNRGLAGARNTGIRHACGDYLAFLDGDDLWLPEKLAKHVEHLENLPDVGVSFSRSALIDVDGNSLHTYLMPKLKNITSLDLLRSNLVGNGSAAVMRREVADAVKYQDSFDGKQTDFYFDESLRRSEDIELWLRIRIETPWKLEGLAEALTLYRVNSGGLSANLLQQLESWEQVLAKIRTYAPELMEQWENQSRAYQLRYFARNALRLQAGSMAVKLIHQALKNHWQILLEEPRRTLLTWGGAYLLWLLPKPFYSQIESLTALITGAMQRCQMLH